MKREERFPIEPLPEATWQRIERNVLEQTNASHGAPATKSRVVVRSIAVAVALQVAAAAAFVLWMASSAETPSSRTGGAEAPVPLTSARVVAEREPTETKLGDIAIQVEPASALLLVEGGDASSLVVLERGAAQFSVPTRGKRAPFAVQAGEVRVEVVGTRFRVERRGALVRVDTYEGKVRVVSRGESTFVSRDESWSEPPAPPRAEATPASSGEAAEPTERPKSAAPAAAVNTKAHASVTDRQALQFDRAARLEASDPQQALQLYRSLVSEGGRWGEPALYAMARLSLELGDRANAERLLRQYLERHPRGANVSDVRSLVGQIAAAKGAGP